MSVFDLRVGESGEIVKCDIEKTAEERLKSLGIVAGKRVKILSFSLFKSSVLICCGSVRVAMRASLAKKIEVKKC